MKWFVLSIVIMMAGAGTWAIFLGASRFYITSIFLMNAGKKVPGVFVRYESESVPAMQSIGSNSKRVSATNYFPVFKYGNVPGKGQEVASEHRHLFKYYNSGDCLKVWESGSPYAKPRIAGFYSLFFLDLLTAIVGLLFVVVPISLYLFFSPIINNLEHEIKNIQNETVIVERPGIDNYDEKKDVASYFNKAGAGKSQNQTKLFARLLHDTGALKYVNYLLWFMGSIIALAFVSNVPYFWKHFIFEFTPPGHFIRAIHNKEKTYIDKYLEHAWGVNWQDKFGQTALLVALEEKNIALAKKLIEIGADVNITSKLNYTPLDYAVKDNETGLVKLLLEKGAKINLCEQYPLLHVVKNRNLEILKLLIHGGADLGEKYNARHGNKITLLQFAEAKKWTEGVVLIETARPGFTKSSH